MDINKIKEVLKEEPRFRFAQAEQAVFKNLINDWSQAVSLPKDLRDKLNRQCPIDITADILTAQDGQSQKAVLTLSDGLKIETVLMRHKDGRDTVCVSSQVGCPVGCLFCLTGRGGFKRNLSALEIVRQVLFWARLIKGEGCRVGNTVFMGMGEPLLNYDNVLEAIKSLNGKDGLNIGIRHITVSTIGIPEGIKKLASEKLKPNLAVSLHVANDKLRSKIIPFNKRYPLAALQEAITYYIKRTKQRVTFEYLMLKGYNDSNGCAEELAVFVKKFSNPARFLQGCLPEDSPGRSVVLGGRNFYFVNLIVFNPFVAQKSLTFQPSISQRVKVFKTILRRAGIEVVQRYKFGQDIKAACGQLTSNH